MAMCAADETGNARGRFEKWTPFPPFRFYFRPKTEDEKTDMSGDRENQK